MESPVHIQPPINRNQDGWVLTLINNDGVTKEHIEPPVIDSNQNKDITIRLNEAFLSDNMNGKNLCQVNNWMDETVIWNSQTSSDAFLEVSLVIEAGEISVLEFVFGQ